MDFDWARARKRLSDLEADISACLHDFENRVYPPADDKQAFSRGSSLATGVDLVYGILSNCYLVTLKTGLVFFEIHKRMNTYGLVRSTIHIAQDILDESTKLLTRMERRRRVKSFMVAAGDSAMVSSARSEDHIADMVSNIRDMEEEQHKLHNKMLEKWRRWLVFKGRMSVKEAELIILDHKYPDVIVDAA
ncbi:hypothetical protein EDD37DRAFT_620710 [Exophiala viscosa]|uniref:Uncharacterized protein n=1 Tax=Exophiala viscosa TaxID=2486360 RepID=A0AAN6IJN4_9EURO|nr:hypothetical protein EDD36DRAFT_424788 [Exophiala viscosa]KAI1626829.1 hypothetical protein EDD37DRAFT_620710 [Exophiala viscosa]